jgi:hypothetical protein
VHAPLIAWRWLQEPSVPDYSDLLLSQLAQHLANSILAGMCIHVVFRRLSGERAGFRGAVSIGLRRLFPLAISGLLVMAAMALPAALMLLLARRAPAAREVFLVVTLVWLLVVLASTMVTAGAIAVEGKGPFAALVRSAALTRGCRFKLLIGFALATLASLLVSGLGWFVAKAIPGSSPRLLLLVGTVFEALARTVQATYFGVAYHDLRATKEGVDVRELMRVFA